MEAQNKDKIRYSNPELKVPKVNGEIDFDNPPSGVRFIPLPIRERDAVDWDVDPAYVVRRRIGGRRRLCVMVPTRNMELYALMTQSGGRRGSGNIDE